MRSLDIAGTGMLAQQTNVEVISNNIANMTTTGYKRRARRIPGPDLPEPASRRLQFSQRQRQHRASRRAGRPRRQDRSDLSHRASRAICSRPANSLDRCRAAATATSRSPCPAGDTAYTRDGSFGLSPDGTIVTADGYVVQPGITIPSNATSVTIDGSGQVQATISGQTAPSTVGTIQLAAFPNEAGLEATGDNLFVQSAASGNPVTGAPSSPGFGTVLQGFVETSNVNVVSEITDLITAQRAYEMNSRVITTSDQMLSTLTNLR